MSGTTPVWLRKGCKVFYRGDVHTVLDYYFTAPTGNFAGLHDSDVPVIKLSGGFVVEGLQSIEPCPEASKETTYSPFYTAKSGRTSLKRYNKKVSLFVTVDSEEVFFDVTSFPKDTLRYLADQVDILVARVEASVVRECTRNLEDRIAKALRKA